MVSGKKWGESGERNPGDFKKKGGDFLKTRKNNRKKWGEKSGGFFERG